MKFINNAHIQNIVCVNAYVKLSSFIDVYQASGEVKIVGSYFKNIEKTLNSGGVINFKCYI